MARENKTGEPAADGQEDFLSRWSRRKLDTQNNSRAAPVNASAAEIPSVPTAAEAERELTDADMPPLETLDESSDFSPFLSPGVSDDLRHQAMRKLFSQPAYNITDGLNDYDEDFTQFAGLGKVITHEMKRMLERELEAGSADVQAGQTDTDAAPADDVTAAVETGNTDSVDGNTQNDDTDKSDVSPG